MDSNEAYLKYLHERIDSELDRILTDFHETSCYPTANSVEKQMAAIEIISLFQQVVSGNLDAGTRGFGSSGTTSGYERASQFALQVFSTKEKSC